VTTRSPSKVPVLMCAAVSAPRVKLESDAESHQSVTVAERYVRNLPTFIPDIVTVFPTAMLLASAKRAHSGSKLPTTKVVQAQDNGNDSAGSARHR